MKLLVAVFLMVLGASTTFAQIIPIYPEENAVVTTEELRAIFSVGSLVIENVERDSIRLFFNDQNVSHLLTISDFSVVFTPDEAFLKNPSLGGASKIRLVANVPQVGSSKPLSVFSEISFFVKNEYAAGIKDSVTTTPKVVTPFVNTGTVYTSHLYNNSADSGKYTGELGASGNGYKDKFFYNYNLYLTSDEEKTQQTMQRFRLTTGYSKQVKMTLGDATPLMNEYIANGDRVRGVELNLATPKRLLNYDFVGGYSRRAIAPYAVDDSALSAADSIAKLMNSPLTHNDSSNYIASGTYSRRVLGSRLHFGTGETRKYGLTIMQVRDNVESIDQKTNINIAGTDTLVTISGAIPKDNLMLGQDFSLSFWKKRITFYTNAALSIMVEDIQNGPSSSAEIENLADLDPGTIPFEVADLEPLIIINTSILPLPSPKGIMNSSAIDAGIRLNTPIGSAREKFEIKFTQIGSNYKSLLNESLAANKRGVYVKEELRLLQNRIVTSLKFDFYQDNLNELKPLPTNTKKVTGSLNLNIKDNIPQFTVSVSTVSDVNESPAVSKLDKDNQSNSLNLGTNYSAKIKESSNTFYGNYSRSESETKSSSAGVNSSLSNSFGLNGVTTFGGIPLRARYGYNHTISEAPIFETVIANPTAGASYSVIKDKLDLNLDGRLYFAKNLDIVADSTTNSNRLEGAFSSTYKITEKHILAFNCAALQTTTTGDNDPDYDYNFKLYYEFRY